MNENDRETTPRREPWEEGYYQTGRTRPPKTYRGLIAVLLVCVIFLGGIVSALSMLNIRLFKEVATQKEEAAVSFNESTPEGLEPAAAVPSVPEETQAIPTAPDAELDLQKSPNSVANIPQEGGLSLQQIYEKNIRSVVSIGCGSPAGSSTGTGVILSEEGYIVTNSHVVEGAQSIEVLLTDQRVLPARIVGTDAVSDLAVLYVEAEDLVPAQFGNSDALRVGDSVAAIGDPLGMELRGTLTDGIVSAINRDISTGGRTMTLIQTNAALNSGNSGGPLLNCYGQVVGINTMKIGDYMSSAGVEGLGFAIPSTTVKEVVDQLIHQGYVSGRPYLGLSLRDLSSIDRLYYHLPQGVWIVAVDPASDAYAKGMSPGDLLLAVGSTRVTSADSVTQALYAYEAGDTVVLTFYRNGTQYSLEVLAEQAK